MPPMKLYLWRLRAAYALVMNRDPLTFCEYCDGPYGGWLKRYGGHWDTCESLAQGAGS